MRRVLHIISGLGVGGAETFLAQLAPALSKQGIHQLVVSLTGRGPLAEQLESQGISTVSLNAANWNGFLFAAPRLFLINKRFNPDIIQGWMYHGDLAAAAAHATLLPRGNRQLYWGIRCSDMDLGRHAKIISIASRLSSYPDTIISNSHSGAQIHLARGYSPRKLEIIPNGVDTYKFSPNQTMRAALRSQLGIDANRRVAIHVARVDRMKDHENFLAALHAVPNILGLLVGLGTDELVIPGNAIALGLRTDVPDLMATSDFIVSSSAFGEGFSNVIAEGMASGLAPIATDVGDARVLVGDAGLIVPPSDYAALANALLAYSNLADDEIIKRGSSARARIIDKFSIENAVAQFKEIYSVL